ncbi:Bap-like [Trichomonas vaginalis G3]|uniref:Bap-like n=1 Tax=Trichomonas vaginalis (strain ATCC PRA-98 / G3) TaxID=412133 RepID=A2DGB1_TRIV3|nr:hypothetical protein TVAGG3_0967050 [Trichomonas vaginalis G3]EAY20507.1 Bap-like [Trichomonas vaginalis G3]KAI5488317.1 hypothetical protein TVAGG3_0967050 [Trichomonas vaginalis G3]|eukprot:XP_001581493.1 Bap-like [Trichomonas vaginalis G3]
MSIEDLDSNEIVNLKYKYEGMENYVDITPSIPIVSESKIETTQVEVHLPSKYSGVLQIELVATDSHSLESLKEFVNVTIRNVPQLYISSEVPSIAKGDSLTISGYIADIDPDDSFTFHIDNKEYESKLNRTSENISFSIQVQISDITTGEKSLDIYVTDKYNFDSNKHSFIFFIRAKPEVVIYPIKGKHVKGRQLEFSFKIKDEDEGDSSIVNIKYENKEITSIARKLHNEGRIPRSFS